MRLEDLGPEARFHLLSENVRDYALVLIDTEGIIVDWNSGAERLLGYSEPEALGQHTRLFFTPEDRETGEPEREIRTARENRRAEDERSHMRKDGSRFHASGVLCRLDDDQGDVIGYCKIMRDVTEREQARERLQQELNDKHTLLLETHHRVKNNLEIIVSLLRLQAAHIDDAEILRIFEETQSRVRAVARLHETLYSTADMSIIHFPVYLRELAQDVFTVSGAGDRVRYKIDAADMAVSMEQAIPLALIVHELLTNALIHAFPNHGPGSMEIGLYYESNLNATTVETLDLGNGILIVKDNGIGLPNYIDIRRPQSMGFHLVNVLVRQLRGTLSVEVSNGTKWTIKFPLDLNVTPGSS